MDDHPRARLLNAEGEMIAEGPCWVDESAGTATLEPERQAGQLRKERGALELEFETGRSLRVLGRAMIVRLGPMASRGGNGQNGQNGWRTLYRLRLVDEAPETTETGQDAIAAGGAGEGTLADAERQTPAAR